MFNTLVFFCIKRNFRYHNINVIKIKYIRGIVIKFFLFLIGFGFSIIGFMYIILYLNYLTIGYTFSEYLSFIVKRLECWFSLLGIFLMTFVIMQKEDK